MENAKPLKDLEKEMSNRDVLGSTTRRNFQIHLKLEPTLNDQTLRTVNFELVEKAIFSWFQSMRNENVPLSAAMIQEKALTFAKELNAENLRTSDDWLRCCDG